MPGEGVGESNPGLRSRDAVTRLSLGKDKQADQNRELLVLAEALPFLKDYIGSPVFGHSYPAKS